MAATAQPRGESKRGRFTLSLPSFRIIFRRGGIELPAVDVPLRHLIGSLQFFRVFVLNPQGLTDVIHDVLIGRGVVAAGSFVSRIVRLLPIGIDVPGGHRRARLGMVAEMLEKFGASRTRRRRMAIEIERRGRRGDPLLQRAALPVETRSWTAAATVAGRFSS